jgi:hydrogenase maturation protease
LSHILVIGYGNTLRQDDGVGYRAAELLQQHYHDDPDVEVIASHQLTPEMAQDIAQNDFVLFLDASSVEEPGKISQTHILPELCEVGFTHQLIPAALLSLAKQLYGKAPEAISITLAGWSFKLRDKLSRRAEMLLPVLVHQAKELVERHRQTSPSKAGLAGSPELVK